MFVQNVHWSVYIRPKHHLREADGSRYVSYIAESTHCSIHLVYTRKMTVQIQFYIYRELTMKANLYLNSNWSQENQ